MIKIKDITKAIQDWNNFLEDDYRRIDLIVDFGIKSDGIEESVSMNSYGKQVFEGKLRLNKRDISEGDVIHKIGERTYVASGDDFRGVMKGLVGKINEYERDEKIMIDGFGALNRFGVVLEDGSVKGLDVPGVYKTGESDSDAFKNLFE